MDLIRVLLLIIVHRPRQHSYYTSRRRRRRSLAALWLLLLLVLLGQEQEANAFTLNTYCYGRRTTTVCFGSTQDNNDISTSHETARAGANGYSLLRQPVSENWDDEAVPSFDVPRTLHDKESSATLLDTDWWTSRQQQQQQQQEPWKTSLSSSSSSSPAVTTFNQKHQQQSQPQSSSEESLNLFTRSLETLDYPLVLQALEKECTTVPAKELVRDAMSHLSSSSTSSSSSSSRNQSGSPSSNQKLASQPLTAETVEGAQERYRAVQEMTMLLLQNNHDDDYRYRDRDNRQQRLGAPPLGNSNLNLRQMVQQAANQGIVLESHDICEILNMMNAMENVLLWSDALRNVNMDSNNENNNVVAAETAFVALPQLADCITVNETLHELLHTAFDKDTERLSGSTFPVLGRLRARVKALRADIRSQLETLLALPSMRSKLALESGGPLYSEINGRLVVPVENKHAALGIVHDTSRSGKTVYVEPTELVGPTNDLRQAESELAAEEARVWRMLTEQVLLNREWLETSVLAMGQLDLVLARMRLGQTWHGVVPVVKDDGVISLHNVKHPVLLLRQLDNVVGSDVDLGRNGNQGLVLTGPNSGGKTVILKLLGLMALMARGGIPVPAAQGNTQQKNNHDHDVSGKDGNAYEPRVDFFNPVLADIGDLQSVGGDLSTFSGHMLVCREVLANVGRNALVLMDEVGTGTDPNQGVAIAQALLESLLETGARVAITTHFLQLKQLAASDDRFAVAGMQFVNGRPTYKLLPGTVGESFALAVAERLELPQKVIERANELLDSETRQMGDLIRELEDQKALVDQQAAELEEKRKEMVRLEVKMKEEQIRLEKKQLGARRDEAKKFARKLEEKEQVLENILDKLKSDPSRRIVAKSWDDIKFVKRDALNEAENIPSVLARKKKAEAAMEEVQAELVPIAELREKPDLQEGDMVIICKKGPLLGREATIVKVLGSRVEVKVNNMNVSLKLTQAAMPTKKGSVARGDRISSSTKQSPSNSISKAAEKAIAAEGRDRASNQNTPAAGPRQKSTGVTMRTQSNTVDVRGCNLQEAQEKIKDKFSSFLLSGRSPVVYILHGHGTGGVLKTKVRNWLKSERQLVKDWKAADTSDGGDALTRVVLR